MHYWQDDLARTEVFLSTVPALLTHEIHCWYVRSIALTVPNPPGPPSPASYHNRTETPPPTHE